MQDFDEIMSLSDEEKLDFLNKNIVLEKVDGRIAIELIRVDFDRVYGRVGRAESVGEVEGRVDKAGSVRWVSNEESES